MAAIVAPPIWKDAMSIFGTIMDKIFHHGQAAPAPAPVPAPAAAPKPAPAAVAATPAPVASAPPVVNTMPERMPGGMRAMLQKMRAEGEKRCDYVGSEFAAEARRIHSGEKEQRGIYGEATPEEAERLADDGIAVAQIPWVKRADG